MRYITSFGLGFLLLFCQDSGNSDALFPIEAETYYNVELEYGSGKGSLGENFLPSILEVDKGYCLESRNREIKDYGPRFKLCFQGDYFTKEKLDSVLTALISPGSIQSYPRFSLENELGTISFSFETETSLKRNWKKTPPEDYIVLDLNIRRDLKMDSNSLLGQERLDLSKQYGLPYWNYYGGKECFFFFTTWDIDIPANSRNILKIKIDCDKIKSSLYDYRNHVKATNQQNRDHCINSTLEITEKFSHSESKFGKYIEFYNTENRSICWDRLSWENKDGSISMYSPRPGFLFPQSTVLFTDSSSKLEGIDLGKNFSWSDYFSSKIKFIDIEDSFSQGLTGYKWEDEFFSDQKRANPCLKLKSSYQTEEKFCGSPGSNSTQGESTMNHCKPSEIELLEINAVGIQNSYGLVDTRDKYLELVWKGNGEDSYCNLSSLVLVMGDERIPLSVDETRIQQDHLFIISLSKKIPEPSFLIPRNLYRLSYNKEIRLERFGEPDEFKVLYNQNRNFSSVPIQIVPKDEEGALFSIISHKIDADEVIWVHHPREDYLDWNRGFRNYMSPGQVSKPRLELGAYPSITEVLWAGSYQAGKSISTDRFIEWENSQSSDGSFYLSLFYPLHPTRNQIYLLPRGSGINFITGKPMTCFTRMDGIYISSFSLYQDSVRIDVLDEWGGVQETSYLDTNLYGKNLTSQKFRASAIKPFGSANWSTSGESSSNCMGHVAASPGEVNTISTVPDGVGK